MTTKLHPTSTDAQAMVQRLKALGHMARLAIVRLVVQGPLEGTAVGEIQAQLGIPGSTLSHHLADLTRAGLLTAAKQGTTIRYAAHFEHLAALTEYLWQDCCGGGCRSPHCPEESPGIACAAGQTAPPHTHPSKTGGPR